MPLNTFLSRLLPLLCLPILFAISNKVYADLDLNASIPVDQTVKMGQLKNGLRYYIKKNATPKKKAEIRLVVKAGSIDEDDDQLGAAHFIEHMAFLNTRHFKNRSLIPKLQAMGVNFGADLNAFTSYEYTIFHLPIPTDKKENLKIGLEVIGDWAQGLEMREADLVKERAVILEEARLRNTSETRQLNAMLTTFLPGTSYAKRSPIGTEAVINTFTVATLNRFYKDWYRPERMAIVVVGDIDEKELEKMIHQGFDHLKNPHAARQRAEVIIPAASVSSASRFFDHEQTAQRIEINYGIKPKRAPKTIANLRQQLLDKLYTDLFANRLSYSSVGYNRAYGPRLRLLNQLERDSLSVEIGTAGVKAALDAVLKGSLQIKQFGFSEKELNDTRKIRLLALDREYQERDKNESTELVADFVSNFLTESYLMGIEKKTELFKTLYASITLEEINRYASQQFLAESSKKLLFIGPEKDQETHPSVASLLESLQKAETQKVATPEPRKGINSLMKTPPATAGSIVSENYNPLLGTTELKLSNGITVILKKTNFKNDEIIMFHERFGGASLAEDSDFLNARYANQLIQAMGFDDLAPRDIGEFLESRTAGVSLYTNTYTDTIHGASTSADLETMFQLNYQKTSNPSRAVALFGAGVASIKNALKAFAAKPEAIFLDQAAKTIFNQHPRSVYFPRFEEIEKFTMDNTLKLFDARHKNFYGSTFAFVGNVNLDVMRPLIKQYMANLPSTNQVNTLVDRGPKAVRGIVKKELYLGKDDKSMVQLVFSATTHYSAEEKLVFELLVDLLNNRVTDVLRQKLQLIYGAGVVGNFERLPSAATTLQLVLPCAPNKVEEVIEAVFKEVAQLKEHGPTLDELNKVRKNWLVKHAENLRSDRFWATALVESELFNSHPEILMKGGKIVNALSKDAIKVAANRYLDTANYVQMVMKPETPQSPEQPELVQYKMNLPRDIGLAEIQKADRESFRIDHETKIGRNNGSNVYKDFSLELNKLELIRKTLLNLAVSACLKEAKPLMMEVIDHRIRAIKKIDLTSTGKNEGEGKEMMEIPHEAVMSYYESSKQAREKDKALEPQIKKCADGM